jgi:hypothetical protein
MLISSFWYCTYDLNIFHNDGAHYIKLSASLNVAFHNMGLYNYLFSISIPVGEFGMRAWWPYDNLQSTFVLSGSWTGCTTPPDILLLED